LGSASRTRAIACTQHAWRRAPGNTSRGPRPERAIADHELGLVQPAGLQIAHHARPGLGALAVAVLDREQFLGPVLAHADHDQQAQPVVLAKPDRDVDTVDEQVGVAMEAQRPRPKALVLGLPLLAQPRDRRGRQPGGVLAQQLLERRAQVARREAAQVEHRQHIVDLRRATRVRRQDLRAEPLALAGLLVDALVVDARRADRHGPRPDRHAPLAGAAVAHDQSLAVLIALLGAPFDVVGNLDLQRSRDHPPRALPREIVERDPDLVVLPDGEPANIVHGVPSCRCLPPASVFSNREGTPPSSSGPSTTFGYSSRPRRCGDSSGY
jgi:hypothetical protein